MTRTTNSRLAGFAFLFYIAVGITSAVVFRQASGGAEGAAALANLAQHAPLVRLTVVLTFFMFLSALVLGVTLYALTRDEDRDLAMMALCCRLSEGVVGLVGAARTFQLLTVATAATAAAATEAATAQSLGALMLKNEGWTGNLSAACFAVGSTIFSYLLLRARSIPLWMAWLGLLASVLLVITIPLQLAGYLRGSMTYFMWLPMLVFELIFALWLLIKGVSAPAMQGVRTQTAHPVVD